MTSLQLRVLTATLCALLSAPVLAQRSAIATPKPIPPDVTPRIHPSQCGHFRGHFGPHDFRFVHPQDRRVVEEFHFDMEAQTFLSGRTEGRNMSGVGGVGHGFVYTLKAMPNHVPALVMIEQLGRRLNSEQPQGIELPLECWYLRAFMIAPDDPAVRALYGAYLAYRGRADEARANLAAGDEGTRNSAGLQHQVGLAYVALKDWPNAQAVAMRLERMGYPIDLVARQVRAAGRWDPNLQLPSETTEGAGGPAPAASAAAGS